MMHVHDVQWQWEVTKDTRISAWCQVSFLDCVPTVSIAVTHENALAIANSPPTYRNTYMYHTDTYLEEQYKILIYLCHSANSTKE